MTASFDMPATWRDALAELGAPGWRERKQAIARATHLLDHAAPEARSPMLADLLDRLPGRDVDVRAGAREILLHAGALARQAVAARLVEMCRSGPPSAAITLIELLGELREDADAALLVDLVDEPVLDVNVRAAVAVALGRHGGPAAEAALLGQLDARSEIVRVHALDGLLACQAVVPPLRVIPLVASPYCRKSAAAVLGLSRSPEAIGPLLALVEDKMAGVRAASVVALARLDAELAPADAAAIARGIVELGPSAIARLRALLEHRDSSVREAAMRLCALAGDVESLATVLDVMDDPVAADRAVAMVTSFGAAANAVLRAAAERTAPSRREHLYRLIGALPVGRVDPALLELLAAGLRDASEEAAVAAAEALEKVGDRGCVAALYRAMAHEGPLGEAAATAVAAVLARSGDARDDLAVIVGSQWPHEGALACNLCSVVAALATARYAAPLVGLLGSPDPAVRVAAARALGRIPGEHEGGDALAFALADEEVLVRAAACRSLGQLAPPQAVTALLSASFDRAPGVRAAAVAALVSLDNPVALARLRAIVAEDPVPAVVVHAIAGIGRSGLDQDLTMLMSLSLSADFEVVKAAARALSGFTSHRATAALLGLCAHDRWDVRWAAAAALRDRGDTTAAAPLHAAWIDERDPLVRQVLAEALAASGAPVAASNDAPRVEPDP